MRPKYTAVRCRVRSAAPTAIPKSADPRADRKPPPATAALSATPKAHAAIQSRRKSTAEPGAPDHGECTAARRPAEAQARGHDPETRRAAANRDAWSARKAKRLTESAASRVGPAAQNARRARIPCREPCGETRPRACRAPAANPPRLITS